VSSNYKYIYPKKKIPLAGAYVCTHFNGESLCNFFILFDLGFHLFYLFIYFSVLFRIIHFISRED